MAHGPKDTQERILHRLKIARGHLEKVIKMVNKDEYCIDVIHQSQVVQRAPSNSHYEKLEGRVRGF